MNQHLNTLQQTYENHTIINELPANINSPVIINLKNSLSWKIKKWELIHNFDKKQVKEELIQIYQEYLSRVSKNYFSTFLTRDKTNSGLNVTKIIREILAETYQEHPALINIFNKTKRLGDTLEHQLYVASVIMHIAANLEGWTADMIKMAAKFTLFHDIGKLGVADLASSNKRFTPQERLKMQEHAFHGTDLILNITKDNLFAAIVGNHQIGYGYPLDKIKLTPEEKILYDTIVPVEIAADIFSAILNARAYKDGKKIEEAINISLGNCKIKKGDSDEVKWKKTETSKVLHDIIKIDWNILKNNSNGDFTKLIFEHTYLWICDSFSHCNI